MKLIKINLLKKPEKRYSLSLGVAFDLIKKDNITKFLGTYIIILASLIVSVLLLLYETTIYFKNKNEISRLRMEVSKLEKKIAPLRKQSKDLIQKAELLRTEIASLKKELNSIGDYRVLYDELKKPSIKTLEIITFLYTRLPDDMRVSAFSTKSDGNQIILTIAGISEDEKVIGDFINTLRKEYGYTIPVFESGRDEEIISVKNVISHEGVNRYDYKIMLVKSIGGRK